VTEALTIASLPERIRERCRRADIGVKSTLLQIVRQPDERAMGELLDEIIGRGLTRDGARRAARRVRAGEGAGASGAARSPYTFRYQSPRGEYTVEVRFRRSAVAREEVRAALEAALGQARGDTG